MSRCAKWARCKDCDLVRPAKARGLCGACYDRRYRDGEWDGPPKLAGGADHVWRRIHGEVTTTHRYTVYPPGV